LSIKEADRGCFNGIVDRQRTEMLVIRSPLVRRLRPGG